MRVSIIGGNGLVGNGIRSVLAEKHDVKVYGSSDFDQSTFRFKTSEVFDCDLFIHAAGITDELVENDYDLAVLKSNAFIKYIVSSLNKTKCSQIVYLSTIHVYGDLTQELDAQTLCSPLSIYGLLHLNTEKMFEILVNNSSINYLTLRIPTIYGFPREKFKINRPEIIQFAFPLSLKKSNSITLKSSGDQYRLFTSNYKVGKIVDKWLNDPHKNTITIDVVQGLSLTVKEFANICLEKYGELNSRNPSLIIEATENLIDVQKKIMVDPKYDCDEKYTINQFLLDFFLQDPQ